MELPTFKFGHSLLSFRMYFHPKRTQISRFSLLANLALASHAALPVGKDEPFSSPGPLHPTFCSLQLCWASGPVPAPCWLVPCWPPPRLGRRLFSREGDTASWEQLWAARGCCGKAGLSDETVITSQSDKQQLKQLKPQRADASKNPCTYQSRFKLLPEPKDLIAV